MKFYRVKDWELRFESSKSREYNRKSQSYIPNKCGMGYRRIMMEHDGAAIYGAWCAVVGLLSRQEKPRIGALTDTGRTTGRALTVEEISMLTFVHPEQIARMLAFCGSQAVGWVVVEWRTGSAVPDQSPQMELMLPERGRPEGGVKNLIQSPSGSYDRHCPSPLPLPSPLPSQSHTDVCEIPRAETVRNVTGMKADVPTLEQVKNHAAIVGLPEADAVEFFGYWTAAEWHDRDGVPVRNWKAKLASRKTAIIERQAKEIANGQNPARRRVADNHYQNPGRPYDGKF